MGHGTCEKLQINYAIILHWKLIEISNLIFGIVVHDFLMYWIIFGLSLSFPSFNYII